MKKAIAYVRVSTQEQAKSGLSLEAQEKSLRAYCELRNLDLQKVVIDASVSGGKPLSSRPGGSEVVEAVNRKEVEVVVALKLDRVFRNTADCLVTTEQWTKKGVSLHLTDMGGNAVDTSSSTGRFMLTVLAGVAEMERTLIRERTIAALQHKKTKGERTGSIPYGWMLEEDGKTLIKNEDEQEILSIAKELREAGLSLRKVAKKLHELGFSNRKDKAFNPNQIKRIVEFEPPRKVA